VRSRSCRPRLFGDGDPVSIRRMQYPFRCISVYIVYSV